MGVDFGLYAHVCHNIVHVFQSVSLSVWCKQGSRTKHLIQIRIWIKLNQVACKHSNPLVTGLV